MLLLLLLLFIGRPTCLCCYYCCSCLSGCKLCKKFWCHLSVGLPVNIVAVVIGFFTSVAVVVVVIAWKFFNIVVFQLVCLTMQLLFFIWRVCQNCGSLYGCGLCQCFSVGVPINCIVIVFQEVNYILLCQCYYCCCFWERPWSVLLFLSWFRPCCRCCCCWCCCFQAVSSASVIVL